MVEMAPPYLYLRDSRLKPVAPSVRHGCMPA